MIIEDYDDKGCAPKISGLPGTPRLSDMEQSEFNLEATYMMSLLSSWAATSHPPCEGSTRNKGKMVSIFSFLDFKIYQTGSRHFLSST
jgi:hypothetical protein